MEDERCVFIDVCSLAVFGSIYIKAHGSLAHLLRQEYTIKVSYSYSTGPGIYGSKPTESEGEARGQGLFTLP